MVRTSVVKSLDAEKNSASHTNSSEASISWRLLSVGIHTVIYVLWKNLCIKTNGIFVVKYLDI